MISASRARKKTKSYLTFRGWIKYRKILSFINKEIHQAIREDQTEVKVEIRQFFEEINEEGVLIGERVYDKLHEIGYTWSSCLLDCHRGLCRKSSFLIKW